MRTSTHKIEIEKDREQNRPVELYRLYLDEETVYLACHDQDVLFYDELGQPQVYTGIGISRSRIRTSLDNQVDECTIGINNVELAMSPLFEGVLEGKNLEILKVFLDALDDPDNYVLVFEGQMGAPVITKESFQIRVTSPLDTLNVSIPRRKYQRLCNWAFGSPECGVSLPSVTVYGNVTGVGEDGKEIFLAYFDGNEEYEGGTLIINKEARKISSISGNTIRVEYPFPFDIPNGTACAVRKGCNKTYDESCVGRFGNGANYGGFLSIPSNTTRV